MGRPFIALSGRRYAASEVPSLPSNFMSEQVELHLSAYCDAIDAAGGIPVMLPCIDASVHALDRADALVLTGGGDVDPGLYGEEPHETVSGIDPHRDRVEIALASRALQLNLPILAVCRGLQVLNVALGGSLIQHVGDAASEPHAAWDQPVGARVHSVAFADPSIAHDIFGASVEVNTLHHQAIGRLAPGLVCTGRAPDGIIESIEMAGRPVFGVQWHPELLAPQPDPAFGWLVRSASSRG